MPESKEVYNLYTRDILNLTLFACQSLLISLDRLWASVSMMMWASVMDLSLIVSFLGQLDGLCSRMFPSESSSRISKSFHSDFYILCDQNIADIWVWFCQWSSTEISGKKVWSRSKRHHFWRRLGMFYSWVERSPFTEDKIKWAEEYKTCCLSIR